MLLKLLLFGASLAFIAVGIGERQIAQVIADLANQDFMAEPVLHTISGKVCYKGAGLAGVTVTATGTTAEGAPYIATGLTGTDGKYAIPAPHGWSGLLTPTKEGYTFAVQSCAAP